MDHAMCKETSASDFDKGITEGNWVVYCLCGMSS